METLMEVLDNHAALAPEFFQGDVPPYSVDANQIILPPELRLGAHGFPTPFSAAWGYMNRRRGDLIHRQVYGTLSYAEEQELAVLQRESLAAVDRSFPRPPIDLELLRELQQQLAQRPHGETHE
jgi:hypothetical protein